jgi:hypothetical protein
VVLAVREFEAWIVGGDAAHGVDDPDVCGNLEGESRAFMGNTRRLSTNRGRFQELTSSGCGLIRDRLENSPRSSKRSR